MNIVLDLGKDLFSGLNTFNTAFDCPARIIKINVAEVEDAPDLVIG